MHALRCARCRAFTLIELLVAVAVLALIATLAAPSFTRMMAKKRVEGIASELVTDLQYARSEAAQRGAKVRVTFGTACYVVHTAAVGVAATCNATGPSTVDAGETELKTVQLSGGSTVTLSPNAGLAFLEFDPQYGYATPAGSINVNSTSGEWQLQAVINPVGRVRTCSPNSSVSGYSNNCS